MPKMTMVGQVTKVTGVFLVIAAIGMAASPSAVAQAMDAGALSRDLTKELPRVEREKKRDDGYASFEPEGATEKVRPKPAAKAAKKGAVGVWEEDKDLPEEQLLSSPIRKIYLETTRAHAEISAYLKQNYAGKHNLGSKDLQAIRSAIWGIYLQQGRLAHVSFRVAFGTKVGEASALSVRVTEIEVRDVLVEETEGVTLGDWEKAQIRRSTETAFQEGRILNLERVDAQIKHRMRLGDYDLKVSLEPVNARQVDIKVVATGKESRAPVYLMQYDNMGVRSFGKDRAVGGISAGQVLLPGDKAELMALKTFDLGRGDMGGAYFARADYEAPVTMLGVRLGGWASGMHYGAIKGTTANSDSNGDSAEMGISVSRPLYTEKTLLVDADVDFLGKWERSKVNATTVTSDKKAEVMRARVSGQYVPQAGRSFDFGAGFTLGDVDLSGSAGALAQDKITARTQGLYTKVTWDAGWREGLDEEGRMDLRVKARGQVAFKNMDSTEKFTLGGASGLRAFGSGEASGDHGVLASAELGYTFFENLRGTTFYELGGIWRNYDPWTNDAIPNSYMLQDVGVGLQGVYGPIEASLTYAQQLGPNLGLTSDSKDSDNIDRRYRIWSTLSYRY